MLLLAIAHKRNVEIMSQSSVIKCLLIYVIKAPFICGQYMG